MERFISASLVSDAPPINGVLADARVKSCEYTPAIKTVSLDIETTMDGKTIHSIAVYSTENQGMENQSPVQVVWLHWPASMPKENIKDLPQYTQVCANERQLLKQFSQWLLDYNPDAIIGWALVQFDFQILCARARELGVRLRLGRGGEEIRWRAGQGNAAPSWASAPCAAAPPPCRRARMLPLCAAAAAAVGSCRLRAALRASSSSRARERVRLLGQGAFTKGPRGAR